MVLVQVFVPAVAVTVMSPDVLGAVSVPSAAMEPLLVAQAVPLKWSGAPSESLASAVIWRVDPARTVPGFGVTSHEATWLATGFCAHLPLRQTCPLPHCASLPHAGARQTPSSQTLVGVALVWHSEVAWQMLTHAELRQTWFPPHSASVLQTVGPASCGLLPWLQAVNAAMAASERAERISRCITRSPCCLLSKTAQRAGRGPRGQYETRPLPPVFLFLFLFPSLTLSRCCFSPCSSPCRPRSSSNRPSRTPSRAPARGGRSPSTAI